ncbi:MAG: hypothetical protein Roseis2KO_44850 [Roseivirga sp.]
MARAAKTQPAPEEATVEESPVAEAVDNIENDIDQQVAAIIKKYAGISITSGFIPVPLLDIGALAAIQVKMIKEIGKVHGLDLPKDYGKSIILNALAASPMAAVGASVLKLVPVVGSTLGVLSFHGYAAASTHAHGKVFHKAFKSGGSTLDHTWDSMKGSYKSVFSKAAAEETATSTAA